MSGGSRTILVTGATGFLGRRLVESFASDGHRVIAGSRSAKGQQELFPAGVHAVALDITEPTTIPPALDGVDIVVHAAAKIGDWGRRGDFLDVIHQGTQNLVDACAGRELVRFVHVSSAMFYGTGGRGVMTEGMLPGHTELPYAEAKVAAEQAIKRARSDHRLPTVIVRPANIFGPESELWTERPARVIRRGLMSLPADAGKANLVYVDNVVAAIRAVCLNEAAVGETFNIVDDTDLGWEEVFGEYAVALGKAPPARRPPWLLYGLAGTLEVFASVTGHQPLLTRDAITYLRFAGTYAKGKLEERVGYQPAVPFRDALRLTADYLRDRYARRGDS